MIRMYMLLGPRGKINLKLRLSDNRVHSRKSIRRYYRGTSEPCLLPRFGTSLCWPSRTRQLLDVSFTISRLGRRVEWDWDGEEEFALGTLSHFISILVSTGFSTWATSENPGTWTPMSHFPETSQISTLQKPQKPQTSFNILYQLVCARWRTWYTGTWTAKLEYDTRGWSTVEVIDDLIRAHPLPCLGLLTLVKSLMILVTTVP
jgi:hypothetical protein